MKLSIITTVYKAEDTLPRLLDSMLAQKSSELEFFLIDNGSPDRCGEIMQEYAKRDTRFTVYTIKDNIGYIRARNEGIRVSDGDYIGFCDSDDYLEPGAYDRAVERIHSTDCDLYITSYRTKSGTDDGYITDMPYPTGLYKGLEINRKILPAAFGRSSGQPALQGFMWKQVFRHNILLENGLFFMESLKPYEDQILNIDFIGHCRSVYVDDNIIYNYIVNSASITAGNFRNFKLDDEYRRVHLLYDEKIRRADDGNLKVRACNNTLFSLYSMALVLAKQRSRSVRRCALELRNCLDTDWASGIAKNSAVKGNAILSVTSVCLKTKSYFLLLSIIRNMLRLTGKLKQQ